MRSIGGVAEQRITIESIIMSVVQVMAHGGGGFAADRTPFFGIRLPPEVKKLVQLSKTIDPATFKKILKCMFPPPPKHHHHFPFTLTLALRMSSGIGSFRQY